jgi:ABC-2 type transport system permease protein
MGTLEILLTAPVRDWELVIGKWLGSVLFLATLLAITWIYPIALNNMVDPGIDQGPLVTGMLGLLLMAASLIAIGVAISACFSNQIAAFFVSLVVVLVIWLVRPASAAVSGLGGQVLSYLNYVDHFLPFYQGVISVSDLVYFISITILGLVIGTVLVEVRRWR